MPRDRTIGIAWTVAAAAIAVALTAGLIVVALDPSIEQFGRWTLAMFFLVGPLLWVTRRHRATLERFFRR